MNRRRASVLTIGPDFKNHRGGIGAVLATYKEILPNFIFIPSYKPLAPLILLFYFLKQLCKIIFYLTFNSSAKIVHIHGASRGSFIRKYLIFLIAKYIFRRKVIYHIHGAEFHIFYQNANKLVTGFIKHFLENADVIICLSQSWKDFFTSNFKPKQIEVIPNTVLTPISTLKPELNKIRFLFLGRIGERKGIYDLVDVCKNLAQNYPDKFELLVGGDGETEELKQLIRTNHLEGYINYKGWVDGTLKNNLLSTTHVFVLPSYNEGLPVSILEAMSYGMPIISTNVGGISELIIDKESGFIIEPGDKVSLSKAMIQFILDKNKVLEMGEKSLALFNSKYSPEIITNQLNRIYNQLSQE